MPKHKDERRELPPKVFGVKLDPRSTEVPENLEMWLSLLESDPTVEGLFRVNGSSMNIAKLRNSIECGEQVDYLQYTCHDITGIVKMYFRELPVSLIPVELYNPFIEISLSSGDSDTCSLEKLQKVIKQLPCGHKAVLFRLAKFFTLIALHYEVNSMSIENLATVFASNLFRHPHESTNIELVVVDYPLQIKVINTIILHYTTIFQGFVPGVASAETIEKVNNFKRMIEEQYSVGNAISVNTFTKQIKNKYAYRVSGKQIALTDSKIESMNSAAAECM